MPGNAPGPCFVVPGENWAGQEHPRVSYPVLAAAPVDSSHATHEIMQELLSSSDLPLLPGNVRVCVEVELQVAFLENSCLEQGGWILGEHHVPLQGHQILCFF